MPAESDSVPTLGLSSRYAIGRIRDAVSRWRVVVETWPEPAEGYRGRFIFQPDDAAERYPSREGPAVLHGRTPEDVVRAAYDLTEDSLRTLLRSLS